jgi:hypothetical protein
LQEEPQPQAPRRAEQLAPSVSLPRALPFQQQKALQEPRVLLLRPPPDASAPLSPPRPSRLCPLWPLLLPLLPHPLLPEDVCALSPRHPQE